MSLDTGMQPCDLDTLPDDVLLFDGIPHSAILGTTMVWADHTQVIVAVYSGNAILDYFMAEGMDEDDAREYIDFNMTGAFISPHPPIILWP